MMRVLFHSPEDDWLREWSSSLEGEPRLIADEVHRGFAHHMARLRECQRSAGSPARAKAADWSL